MKEYISIISGHQIALTCYNSQGKVQETEKGRPSVDLSPSPEESHLDLGAL